MKQIIFFLKVSICLMLLSTACVFNKEATPVVSTLSKPLIIIGTDLSGTFSKYERIPPQYLTEICEAISKNGRGGVIAAAPIGNPNSVPLLRCKLIPLIPVDSNATLSTVAKQVQSNKKILGTNQETIKAFIDKYSQSIYKSGEHSETDLQRFIYKALALANESAYLDYEKHIFIYSDGLHDVYGNKKMVLPSEDKLNGIHFYGCGINNQDLIDTLDIQTFEAPEGFLNHITNLLSKNN